MPGHGSPQKRFDAFRNPDSTTCGPDSTTCGPDSTTFRAAKGITVRTENHPYHYLACLLARLWIGVVVLVVITAEPLISAEPPSAEQLSAEQLSAELAAENTAQSNASGHALSSFLPLYDASTKPFRLRWSPPVTSVGSPSTAVSPSAFSGPVTRSGDQTGLTVSIDALKGYAGNQLRLQYELVEVPNGTVVAREQTEVTLDAEGKSQSISVADHSPERLGVYEIRLRLLQPKDKIWERFSLRNSEIVAQTQTPWMVGPQQNATPDQSSDVRRTNTAAMRWRNIGQATQFDANLWMGTRWIPDATRFVPGAKRVGESIPIPHWRDAQPLNNHRLQPQQEVIAVLPVAGVDDRCQLQFSIEQQTAFEDNAHLRIEVASSPQFDSFRQGDSYLIEPQFDAGATAPLANRHVALAYHATGKPQFVRIQNRSSNSTVAIQSIDLLIGDESPQRNSTIDASRHLTWSTRSWDWTGALVDHESKASIHGRFSESTQLFEILWLAMNRLDRHASWLQYDRLMIQTMPATSPKLHTELQRIVGAESSSDLRWCGAFIAQACESWSQTIRTPIELVDPQEGFQAEAAVVSHKSTSSATEGVLVGPQLHAKLIERLIRDSPQRIIIDSESLPMAVDPQLLRTTEQIKRVPRSMRGIAAVSANGIQADRSASQVGSVVGNAERTSETLGVHVFVSESRADHAIVTLINEAPWTNTVRLDLETPSSLTNPSDDSELQPDDRIVLPPASVVNLVADRSTITINGWTAEFENSEQTVEHLKAMVSTVVNHIGTLGSPEIYDGIRNANFEADGKVGIVGWMHTQFPTDAVQLDADEASEGSQSIRLLTTERNPGGVWIVSEPIEVPATGRLSVSMSLRTAAKPAVNPVRQTAAEVMMNLNGGEVATASGDPKPPEVAKANQTPRPPNHDLRVSLEGIRGGEPVRFVSQFSLPCNGQWQTKKNILEIEGLNPDDLETIRLTIDSLSPGKLWIDDVRLHDNFATRAERSHLQGKVFLAIQGLQRGSYAPAAELLRNHWAQYLLISHHADVPVPTGTEDAPASGNALNKNTPQDSTSPASDSTPDQGGRDSVAERIRDWLPRPIRF